MTCSPHAVFQLLLSTSKIDQKPFLPQALQLNLPVQLLDWAPIEVHPQSLTALVLEGRVEIEQLEHLVSLALDHGN